jgi:hypothetical protein
MSVMVAAPMGGSENGSTLVLAEGKHITDSGRGKKKVAGFCKILLSDSAPVGGGYYQLSVKFVLRLY